MNEINFFQFATLMAMFVVFIVGNMFFTRQKSQGKKIKIFYPLIWVVFLILCMTFSLGEDMTAYMAQLPVSVWYSVIFYIFIAGSLVGTGLVGMVFAIIFDDTFFVGNPQKYTPLWWLGVVVSAVVLVVILVLISCFGYYLTHSSYKLL